MIWTSEYIVAAVAGTPDADAAAGRLPLRNQEDIGAAIAGTTDRRPATAHRSAQAAHHDRRRPRGGREVGRQAAFATHDARWTANAGEIAAFLAGANPNWPEKDVLDLLALHLKLTKDEAVARLTGDWAADVKAFDDIFTEIMVLADALHDGIVAQFPIASRRVGARA